MRVVSPSAGVNTVKETVQVSSGCLFFGEGGGSENVVVDVIEAAVDTKQPQPQTHCVLISPTSTRSGLDCVHVSGTSSLLFFFFSFFLVESKRLQPEDSFTLPHGN